MSDITDPVESIQTPLMQGLNTAQPPQAGIAPSYDPEIGGWHAAFKDPENNGGMTPGAVLASKTDENPQDFRDLSINMNGLAYMTGKPLGDVSLNYEQEKQDFVKRQGWDMPKTESQFRNQLGGYVESIYNKHEAVNELFSSTVMKALEDTDYGNHRGIADFPTDLTSVWQQKNAPLIPDQKERDAYHAQSRSVYLKTLNDVAPIRKEIATSLKVLNDFTTGKANAEDMQNLGAMFKDMPADKMDKILSYVSVASQREHLDKKQTKGFLQNLGESISRGGDFAGDAFSQSDLLAMDRIKKDIDAGKPIYLLGVHGGDTKNLKWSDVTGETKAVLPFDAYKDLAKDLNQIATPEQVAALKSQVEDKIKSAKVATKLKQFAQSAIDPITPLAKEGTWARTFEQAAYDVGSSIAPMGAVAISPLLGFEAYQTMHFNDLLIKNPDKDIQHLNTIAGFEGALEAIGDMIEIRVLKGVMPKIIDNYVKKFGNKGVRAVLRAAEAIGFEYAIETAQDAIPAVVEGAANAIGNNIEQTGTWDDFNVFDARRFWAMAFMGGVGAGVATFRDLKDPTRQLNRTIMGYNGVHGAKAEYVLAAESAEEADARLQEVYNERTDKDKAKGIELLVKDSIKAQERPKGVDTYTAERNAADQVEWVVSDPSGKEVGRFADEESARGLISDRIAAADQNEKNAVQDLIDYWQQQDPTNKATIEAPRTVQQELDRLKESGDAEGIANLHERITFAKESGDIAEDADLNKVNILGGAKLETTAEGVFRGVISLSENAKPEDAFEEINHVFVKRALAEGRVTFPQLQEWIAQTEKATGQKYANETETDVIENIAKIGWDYAAGRIDESAMPRSFVDYVKRMLSVLKEAMLRALKLKDAFATGKIDKDFESFLAESVGLDPQIMFDKESDRVAGEIKGETSYSIKAATDIAKENQGLAKELQQQVDALKDAEEKGNDSFFSHFWPQMLKKAGLNYKPSIKNLEKAAEHGMPAILDWLKNNPQYLDYYHKDWDLTRGILTKAFPDFTDDELHAFRLFTGVTSPNTGLAGNLKDAVQLLNLWKNEGSIKSMTWKWSAKGNRAVGDGNPFKLESTTGAGKIFASHILENLHVKLGSWKAVNDFMHESIPVKELHAFNKEMGYAGGVGDIGKVKEVTKQATGQDELIPRMFIFGPKVGAYTLNTTGDDRFTTTDIWEARFIRSHFPEMFQTSTGLPTNVDEHEIFQKFANKFNEVFKRESGYDLPPSALQAVRWFYMIDHAKQAGYQHARTDGSISDYTAAALKQKLGIDVGHDSSNRGFGNGGDPAGSESFSIRSDGDIRDEIARIAERDGSTIRLAGWSGFKHRGSKKYGGRGNLASVTSDEFSKIAAANKAAHKFGYSVDVYGPEDYKDHVLVLIEKDGHTCTLSISPSGELGSATKSLGGESSMVDTAFDAALATGKVKWLNAFDTVLPQIYAPKGFEAVARLKFDEQYMPEGWDFNAYQRYNNGRPDVVFMRRNPNAPAYKAGDGKYVADYDEASRLAQQPAEDTTSFSIRSQEQIDSVAEAMKNSKMFPEGNLAVYERAKARFASVLEKNRDVLLGLDFKKESDESRTSWNEFNQLEELNAQEAKEIEKANRNNTPEVAQKIEREIRAKYKTRRDAVAQQTESKTSRINSDYNSRLRREKLKQALIELDGVLKTLPYEVRGRVGGMSVLANIGTGDKALADFFKKRVEMLDKELERYLGKEYDEATYKFLQTTLPKKRKAGEKPKGIGADIQAIFAKVREAQDWSAEEVRMHLAGIDAALESEDLTPEREAKLTREADLVSAVGDWKNKTSTEKGYALKQLIVTWSRGYQQFLTQKMVEKQERDADRSDAITNTGKEGLLAERQRENIKQNGNLGILKKTYFNLTNWDQFVSVVFGENSETAKMLVNGERHASNIKMDRTQAKLDEVDDLFTRLAGSRLKGEELRWEMSQKSIAPFQGTPWSGLEFSQLEALSATMLWMQEDGRRHMEGKFDDAGKPISAWRYTQEFVDTLENSLTKEAKEVRAFLLEKYATGYHDINKVYTELNGVSLPQIQFYSPVTVAPINAPKGMSNDPVTGAVVSGMSSSPSALRTRGTSISEPNFRDVLQTYSAHTLQMEHWMAYAPFMKEANGILRNRDVQNAIEAKGGEEARNMINLHLDVLDKGGVRDAAAKIGLNEKLAKLGGRAAQVALVGRISTILLQSTQLGASLAEMPTGAYILRMSKLLSGNLGWGEALKSSYIQRRLKEMPPIVRQAMEGLQSDRPNVLKHTVEKLGRIISGADALFTAGTYAITYDYHLKQAQSMGIPSPEEYARNVAERAVDKLAQPTRLGARSIFENTQTGPFARVGWAFASEARKNVALAAYNTMEKPAGTKARTLFSLIVLNSLVSTLIRNAWKDAKDDDDDELLDEKHWSPKRLAIAVLTDPLQGIPLLGDAVKAATYKVAGEYLPNDNLFSMNNAAGVFSEKHLKNVGELLDGNGDWEMAIKDLDNLASGMGMLNGNIAAAASLTHLAADMFGVSKNTAKALK